MSRSISNLERKTIKNGKGKSITIYLKTCEKCGNDFWVPKRFTRFCGRNCSNIHMRKIRDPLEHFFREKLTRVRSNAKARGISLNITWLDIFNQYQNQNGLCYYSRIPMNLSYGVSEFKVCPYNQLSIDRKDSSIGYTKDNIVLSCYCINNFKGDLTVDQFREVLRMLFINLNG